MVRAQRTLGGSPQGDAGGVWGEVWGGQALGVANRLLDFQRAAQHGVLARRQLLEAGLDDDDIARMLRRRELRRVHRGVYVDHTGPLTWPQREWVAVLAAWPAALCHESAVPGLTSDRIHVAIGLHRRVEPVRGVVLHATAGLQERVERAHGLPRPDRQRPSTATGRRTVQDVRYERYGLVVELDGRAIHDNPRAWDADARRDLAELAVADARSARVTYGLVFGEPCLTAARIALVLRRGGWAGELRRCPDCPPAYGL